VNEALVLINRSDCCGHFNPLVPELFYSLLSN